MPARKLSAQVYQINNVFINFQEKMLMNITVEIVPDAGFFLFPL